MNRVIARVCGPACRSAVLFCLAGAAPTLLVPRVGVSQATSAAAQIAGVVVDRAGNGVAGAVVALWGPEDRVAQISTDAAGRFSFQGVSPAAYAVRTARKGESAASLEHVQPGGPALRIVLPGRVEVGGAGAATAGQDLAFSDKPNFTVAGVTDWTAAGGHGSDVTLRASEELARESTARGGAATGGKRGVAATPDPASAAEESRLRAAVSAQPKSYAAHHALGQFYLHAGRYASAEQPLETASELGEHADVDEYLLARTCEGLGDHAKALAHIQRALERQDNGEYHALAGEVEEKLQNPLAAVQQMQLAVKLEPSESNYFAWGSELLLHRAPAEAADVFRAGANRYPASVRLRSGWGAALYAGGRYDEAATQLCAASDLAPQEREPYVTMGKADVASPRELACVGERLARFLKQRPEDADANFFSAMDLLKHGAERSVERATVLLQTAIRVDPQYAPALLQMGVQAANRRDYPKAIGFYRQAIAADPQMIEAHYRLALALQRTGMQEEGRAELARRDQLARTQADAVEQQRREIKQFVVETRSGAGGGVGP